MIITRLNGGLGNQMFQYAAGKSLAYSLSTELKMDISPFQQDKKRYFELAVFNITGNIASAEDLNHVTWPLTWMVKHPVEALKSIITHNTPVQYIKESRFHFDPKILALPDNVYLEGHWQSEKYFKDIEKIIREDFTFSEEPDYQNKQMADMIKSCEAVSLHVRRGDYVSNPETTEYHGICSEDYYRRAIRETERFCKNPHFFVFSDDPSWAKENLETGYPTTIIDFNGSEKDYEDLRLMSVCQHHIIANSSFSWWGAWLSQNP